MNKDNTENIIVMGSKFGAILPNINASKIYTANAAAEFGKKYKLNTQNNCEHIAVFGKDEFLKNSLVNKKIVESKPDRIVIRDHKFDIKNYMSNEPRIDFFSTLKCLLIQSYYVKGGLFKILKEDFFLSNKKSIKDFLKMVIKNKFQGFSTGFFCLLLARYENPNSNIIFSGIGLKPGGGYFYSSVNDKGYFSDTFEKSQKDNFRNHKRKIIDISLFSNLKENKFSNIYTNDKEFIELQNKEYKKSLIKYHEK